MHITRFIYNCLFDRQTIDYFDNPIDTLPALSLGLNTHNLTVRAITAQISCGIALERQCSPRSRTRTPEQRSLIADRRSCGLPKPQCNLYLYLYQPKE